MDIEQRYDELDRHYQRAHESYAKQYSQRVPPPVYKPPGKRRDEVLERRGLIVIMLASMVVSATHTIPVFTDLLPGSVDKGVRLLFGCATFVMVEAAIVIFAYSRTKNTRKDTSVTALLNAGIILPLITALLGNVYSTFDATGSAGGWFEDAIALLAGIAAPLSAFISGELLAIRALQNVKREREAMMIYEAEMADWQSKLDASWNANKKKFGVDVAQIVRHDSPSARPSADGHGHATGNGYSKRTDARTIVADHLSAHPEDINANVRDLAARLGVGKTTVSEVQREFRQ